MNVTRKRRRRKRYLITVHYSVSCGVCQECDVWVVMCVRNVMCELWCVSGMWCVSCDVCQESDEGDESEEESEHEKDDKPPQKVCNCWPATNLCQLFLQPALVAKPKAKSVQKSTKSAVSGVWCCVTVRNDYCLGIVKDTPATQGL